MIKKLALEVLIFAVLAVVLVVNSWRTYPSFMHRQSNQPTEASDIKDAVASPGSVMVRPGSMMGPRPIFYPGQIKRVQPNSLPKTAVIAQTVKAQHSIKTAHSAKPARIMLTDSSYASLCAETSNQSCYCTVTCSKSGGGDCYQSSNSACQRAVSYNRGRNNMITP
jgi:hypothetical protein